MAWDRYHLGSSYYPEWWPEEQWADDFRKMRDLGFNTVRMGEFAWSSLEPEQGRFAFEWLDRAIAQAARHGIGVILCTPTATVPPWLRKAHPDVLGGNEKGPFDFGARKGWCLSSMGYRRHARSIVEAVAAHFGTNPHVIGWQLDNEPGYPFVCYDANCRRNFATWLRQGYGTLDALNAAWFTSFWSQHYTDWGQVEFPLNRPDGAWNPGQRLDYHRFFASQFRQFLAEQTAILRQHIAERFIFTNWPNTFWSVDCFSTADFLDATAWDNYTATPGVTPWREQYGACIHHDLARNAGPQQRWMCAEQAAQVPAHALIDGIRLQTWLDVAHGSYGTVFFEWRPPLGGAEQGYHSVLALDGTFGPAEATHRRLGKELERLGPELAGATMDADVALLYCYTNQWEQGWWCGENGYDAECSRWYKGLKALQRNVDVIPPSRDLARYRLIAAPNLRIVSDTLEPRLRAWVEAGGVLLLNHQAGTRDEENRYRPLVTPGVFSDLAGVRVPHAASRDAMAGQLILGKADQNVGRGLAIVFKDKAAFAPATILEGIVGRVAHSTHGRKSVEVVATFRGGRTTGKPAVTVNRVGKGLVFYCGTDSRDDAFYEHLARCAAGRAGLEPILAAPHGVCVTSRRKEGREYVFLLNLTEKPATARLPASAQELTEQRRVQGKLALGPLSVAVLRFDAADWRAFPKRPSRGGKKKPAAVARTRGKKGRPARRSNRRT